MKELRLKQYLEPIGLALLLFAFGWQCFEERAREIKYDGYIYELDKKLENNWSVVYDEALHSDRYKGQAAVYVDIDVLNQSMRDWQQIQNSFNQLDNQMSFFFWVRVVLYLLGSYLVILAKWPQKSDDHGECQ